MSKNHSKLKVGLNKNQIPVCVFTTSTLGKKKVRAEFKGKSEFKFISDFPYAGDNKPKRFWDNLKLAVTKAIAENHDYLIICLDSHEFSESYNFIDFQKNIAVAKSKNVDILLGGVYRMKNPIKISDTLFWIDDFRGIQFTIIFKRFFKSVLDVSLNDKDDRDVHKFSSLTKNKMILYPFISKPSYIDSPNNRQQSSVQSAAITRDNIGPLFALAGSTLDKLTNISNYYNLIGTKSLVDETTNTFDNVSIPTYIINLPERKDRLKHINNQFKNRSEFDIKFIEACRHEIGAVGLWNSFRKIINIAQENNDDVIIICEDDHQFSKHYCKNNFIKNVIEAHKQNADILTGGFGDSFVAQLLTVRIEKNRYWINFFLGCQFIVVYKKIFKAILDSPFNDEVMADNLLSNLTINKMSFYPFISFQKSFGYSDVTKVLNDNPNLLATYFERAECRLKQTEAILKKYNVAKLPSKTI